jgi:hypothetical protein
LHVRYPVRKHGPSLVRLLQPLLDSRLTNVQLREESLFELQSGYADFLLGTHIALDDFLPRSISGGCRWLANAGVMEAQTLPQAGPY